MNLKKTLLVSSLVYALFPVHSDAATATSTSKPSAKSSALFSKGAETFRLQDNSGKTPTFRVLDDTPSEKALALAIITALNSRGEVQPKIPVRDHIDLRIERLRIEPAQDNKDELELSIKLSGYDLELSETVSRSEFLSGKSVEVNFPTTDREVSLFSVKSEGKLRMRWDAKANILLIENATARLDYQSPIAGAGEEALKFSGRGVRL